MGLQVKAGLLPSLDSVPGTGFRLRQATRVVRVAGTLAYSMRRMTMDRRELLGVLGATAAGLVAVASGREARAEHEDDIHETCAEACSDCEKQCNRGFHHCYTQVRAGKQEHARAMHLC